MLEIVGKHHSSKGILLQDSKAFAVGRPASDVVVGLVLKDLEGFAKERGDRLVFVLQ